MKLKDIYKLAIKEGRKADPRSDERIKRTLIRIKKRYEKLDKEEKEQFDKQKFKNPYSDTRILVKSDEEVKKILVGIDIGPAELMLAKEFEVDAVIAHHPLGPALSQLNEVMELQADLLSQVGVPINIAESLLEKRTSEVSRQISPLNHYQIVDSAQLLNIPLICIHTPTDNIVYQFVKEKIEKKDPETVEELIKELKNIPEYRKASKMQIGPKIFAGGEKRRTGKIAFTEVTGGTAGAKEIYEKLSQAGIGTIVGMHMEEEYKKEAEKHHLNVVIAGHMASDSVGMNLFLDKLDDKIEIIRASGLIGKDEE